MIKKELEKYIGKRVTITLSDNMMFHAGDSLTGVLYNANNPRYKNNPNIYYSPEYFLLEMDNGEISSLFRASYITRCKATK